MYDPEGITRRGFVRTLAAGLALTPRRLAAATARGETLYNGIVLPHPWPPRLRYPSDRPVTPPYLASPPAVIPIDVGRQLFVDDFLVEQTTLSRTFHQPVYHPASPVLRPETAWERADEYADRTNMARNPTAMVFSDGVFFDPKDRLFKMWYMGGYRMNTCYAVSDDGITWRRPITDSIRGNNIVLGLARDSGTVWLDHYAADQRARYKMALFHDAELSLYQSPDGIQWTRIGETGPSGDRTTFFYNPFRQRWVFGMRDNQQTNTGRYRRYWEHEQFAAAAGWSGMEPVPWTKADSADFARPSLAREPELYNLDCVAYESLMLGLFTIWRGESSVREKINEVVVGYSRDGFHWHRPDRRSFLGVSEEPGSWNWSNVQSAGGGCLIVGDQLYFYMSARTGVPGTGDPGTCTTGLAVLRRDGFASMDWPTSGRFVRRGNQPAGTLTTRPLRFSGRHLFVNAATGEGDVRVDVLDEAGRVIAPFSAERCRPVRGDGTRLAVSWEDAADLAAVADRPVRLRFTLSDGRLYAFWVSPWTTGESRGYPAAGGPAFSGPLDTR